MNGFWHHSSFSQMKRKKIWEQLALQRSSIHGWKLCPMTSVPGASEEKPRCLVFYCRLSVWEITKAIMPRLNSFASRKKRHHIQGNIHDQASNIREKSFRAQFCGIWGFRIAQWVHYIVWLVFILRDKNFKKRKTNKNEVKTRNESHSRTQNLFVEQQKLQSCSL